MYKSQAFTKAQLQSIVIPKTVQDYVLEYHKTPIDLVAGYEILKKDSDNFTKDDPQVQQADQLFYDTVIKYMKTEPTKAGVATKVLSTEALRIREEQQRSELELLALELELETQAKSA